MPSPPGVSEQVAPAPVKRTPRWYTHGWNTKLSWELILRVLPWVPWFLLLPLHHATSLVCFIMMPRERAASRRNLARVTGKTGWANLRLAYRLFFNFSRFMVAYTELKRLDPNTLATRVAGREQTDLAVQSLIDEGRGAIMVTMHLGHWDLALKLLSRFNVPVHVVMLNEDPEEVARFADEARATPTLSVHQMGSSPLLGVELMTRLTRGEFVAIQADRPVGQNVIVTEFFGAPAPLPTGPVQLAMATGVPVLPVFMLFDKGNTYRIHSLPRMHFTRSGRDQSEQDLREAMGRMTEMMESVISRHPDQWFNFFDVWPTPGAGRAGSESSNGARRG